jgi:hypothetical protein
MPLIRRSIVSLGRNPLLSSTPAIFGILLDI